MVSRRQLQRLKEAAKKGAVVIQLRDGSMEAFSQMAPLALFGVEVDEEGAAYAGVPPEEPTAAQGREALRLREALTNATPESRATYETQYAEFLHLVDVLERSRKEVGTST